MNCVLRWLPCFLNKLWNVVTCIPHPILFSWFIAVLALSSYSRRLSQISDYSAAPSDWLEQLPQDHQVVSGWRIFGHIKSIHGFLPSHHSIGSSVRTASAEQAGQAKFTSESIEQASNPDLTRIRVTLRFGCPGLLLERGNGQSPHDRPSTVSNGLPCSLRAWSIM